MIDNFAPFEGCLRTVGCGFGMKMRLSGLLAGFSRTFWKVWGCGRGR
nr:MAG TPA: hypothetical protein [Caudoviricetes sp.]